MGNILTTDIKDIRLGDLKPGAKKKAGKKGAYPSKTLLNLAVKPKTINSPSRAIPLFLVLMLCVAVFCKFAVIDRLQMVVDAEAAAHNAEAELAQMQALTADYEQVRAAYEERVLPAQAMAQIGGLDAMDLLALMENKLMDHARVESFSVQEPLVSVKLAGVTLDETAKLVKALEESPMVAYVMVYTAGTGENAAPVPEPTPVPTPTPKPTKTPRRKKATPTPEQTLAPTPEPTPPDAYVSVTMTITLATGGGA